MDRYRRVFIMMLEIIINHFSSTPNVILVIQKKKEKDFHLKDYDTIQYNRLVARKKKRLRSLHLKVGKLCVKIMKIIMPNVKNLKTKNRILYSWTETRTAVVLVNQIGTGHICKWHLVAGFLNANGCDFVGVCAINRSLLTLKYYILLCSVQGEGDGCLLDCRGLRTT